MKSVISIVVAIVIVVASANAQTTEFTFQGSLKDGANPAIGNYDFVFVLYDSLSGGTQFGPTLLRNAVAVENGVFAVKLDFGNQFLGANRFVEIRVRQTGGGAYTTLTPRQSVDSSPYSVRSLNALNAANAAIATTANNALQLGGVAAGQYVLTADPRMTDPRAPTAGSSSYIQNTTSPQASSNFSISDTGTANIFNATTQFNIGGNRVLSVAGVNNIFAGVGAGTANTSTGNSFFGNFAGQATTSGGLNSFFGKGAGQFNTLGTTNSFVGAGAGAFNTIGSFNSFFGVNAGSGNISGSNNTLIGDSANVANGALNFATAVGAGAIVNASNTLVFGRVADSVQIPGGLLVTGAFAANGAGLTNLNASNISSGTLDNARLGIVPITNGGTGSATQNFVDLTSAQTVGGDKTFSNTLSGNVVNAATQFNIAGTRILSVNFGVGNLFVGLNAGANTTGASNSFFGNGAGVTNTTGFANSFFGRNAGENNGIGEFNSFFGSGAGNQNTDGVNNAFFGANAGAANKTGGLNAYFGYASGVNSTGSANAFFGGNSGVANTTGADNVFVGAWAGSANTTGDRNSFFGRQAGSSNATAWDNSFFGYQAGRDNIEINNSFFGSNAGSSNTTGGANSFFGESSGRANLTGSANSFFGRVAGLENTEGNDNSFFGVSAGRNNLTGDFNSFFGASAGVSNITGDLNTIIGYAANVGSTDLINASAFGSQAYVTQSNSIVLGRILGINNAAASTNVGIGTTAPQSRLHINTNGGNILFGNMGCNAPATGISFSLTLNCNNYSILGDGIGTLFNRPLGGFMDFRENNVTQMSIAPGGIVRIFNLAGVTATTLCRTALNEIAACTSSLRYKEKVNTFAPGLDLIKRLRPVSFNWIGGGDRDLGLVAEDVDKVEPLLVTRDNKNEIEGVKYDRIGVVLINAVKEQQSQIERQQELLKRQQAEIDALKKLMCLQNPAADICKPQN